MKWLAPFVVADEATSLESIAAKLEGRKAELTRPALAVNGDGPEAILAKLRGILEGLGAGNWQEKWAEALALLARLEDVAQCHEPPHRGPPHSSCRFREQDLSARD